MKAVFIFFVIATVSLFAHVQENFVAMVPKGSKQLDQNRFQSSLSYDDTKREFALKFLKSAHIKPLGEEINLPHVRAISYQNHDKNARFFAINIYLNVQTGLTEIFFVANAPHQRVSKP